MEIPIDQIKIDVARIRKDVGDIDVLAESIKSHGLIHAIVLDEWKSSYGRSNSTAAIFDQRRDLAA